MILALKKNSTPAQEETLLAYLHQMGVTAAEEVIVLHIAGSHLEQVDIFKQGKIVGAHNFGDHREIRFPAGQRKQF